MVSVGGCVRWPDEPGPEPGEPEYQLEITVEVVGEINTDKGIYYIVLNADGELIDGPGDDVEGWEEDFYYVKLDGMGFYFAQNKEDSESLSLVSSSSEGSSLQVIIALSDLGDPSSVDINVLTTNLNNITYDSLDYGFNISTGSGSSESEGDSEGDSGDGGADFDITDVSANIKIP